MFDRFKEPAHKRVRSALAEHIGTDCEQANIAFTFISDINGHLVVLEGER